jgi:hypothetical protein
MTALVNSANTLHPERFMGLLRNPDVAIGDWAEPIEPEPSEADDDDDAIGEEAGNGDQDPQYVEREAPPGLNANDEPEFDDQAFRALLAENMNDMDDEEWEDLCRFV